MARPVSLQTLQTRETQAQERLARERRTLARVRREAAQAEAATRRARWCALGEVVDAVCGPLTPDELKDVLRRLESYGIPTPKNDMRVTSFPQGETPQPQELDTDFSETSAVVFRQQQATLSPSKQAAELS